VLGEAEMVGAAHRVAKVPGFWVFLRHGGSESPEEGWQTHLSAGRTFVLWCVDATGM